jgi:hypothetical protein
MYICCRGNGRQLSGRRKIIDGPGVRNEVDRKKNNQDQYKKNERFNLIFSEVQAQDRVMLVAGMSRWICLLNQVICRVNTTLGLTGRDSSGNSNSDSGLI